MRKVPDTCISATQDSTICFSEKLSVIRFHNPNRYLYKRVQVDGCAIIYGIRCGNLLCSADEREERYVELKGSDVIHAIDQLRTTILTIGEHDDKRHCYVVCTKVAPRITSLIQKAKMEFKRRFNAELEVKSTPLEVRLT